MKKTFLNTCIVLVALGGVYTARADNNVVGEALSESPSVLTLTSASAAMAQLQESCSGGGEPGNGSACSDFLIIPFDPSFSKEVLDQPVAILSASLDSTASLALSSPDIALGAIKSQLVQGLPVQVGYYVSVNYLTDEQHNPSQCLYHAYGSVFLDGLSTGLLATRPTASDIFERQSIYTLNQPCEVDSSTFRQSIVSDLIQNGFLKSSVELK